MGMVEASVDRRGVATITLNRPEKMNAVDHEAQVEMDAILNDYENDASIRAIVVTGAGGKAFCAGSDMSVDPDAPDAGSYWLQANPNGYCGLSLRKSLRVPVIARVDGYALGGGLEMMLGCDMVIATEDSQFGLTEPLVGRLPSDGGVPLILNTIPRVLGNELLLTGRRFDAKRAAQAGLINAVVKREDLDTVLESYIDGILRCSPRALAAVKSIAVHSDELGVTPLSSMRTPELWSLIDSGDGDSGVEAFRDKRMPPWYVN